MKSKTIRMKPLKIPEQQIRSEIKAYAFLGMAFALIGLVIFWFVGAIGVALGLRGLMLSFDKRLETQPTTIAYRWVAGGAMVIGVFDVLGGLALMI